MAPRILLGAVLVLTALGAVTADAASITTTFSSNNGQNGNMFDVVVAGNSLTVTSLDLNIDAGTPLDIELYTKAGTWVGFETTPSAWSLVDSVTGVIALGIDVPTPVDFADFVLSASSTTGIYVTVSNALAINYTNGSGVGSTVASNADLDILEGAGKEHPFGGTFNGRIWNGTINYEVGAVIPEPGTYALFALGLGALALVRSRRRR